MALKALLIGIPLGIAFLALLVTGETGALTEAVFWTAIGTLLLGGAIAGIQVFSSGLGDASIIAIMAVSASTIFYASLLVPSYQVFADMPGGSVLSIVLMVMYSLGVILLAVGSSD